MISADLVPPFSIVKVSVLLIAPVELSTILRDKTIFEATGLSETIHSHDTGLPTLLSKETIQIGFPS